mgnify:CR=1 FL=1
MLIDPEQAAAILATLCKHYPQRFRSDQFTAQFGQTGFACLTYLWEKQLINVEKYPHDGEVPRFSQNTSLNIMASARGLDLIHGEKIHEIQDVIQRAFGYEDIIDDSA